MQLHRSTILQLAISGQLICAVHGQDQLIGNPPCHNGLSASTLGLSNETHIFFPDDSEFVEATIRWTNYSRPTFSAAAVPALESDVQKLVRFASACNIPFLATAGAHGFSTTFGTLHQGLEINLSKLRNVSVNAAASTMTVGGGVRFSDAIDPAFAAGKEFNHGTGSCVGMISPTLGGGVGRYSGLHGMIGDQLLSARVVIANGSIVTASARQNPELFWALRGAGSNFGVVTEATYQVYDLTSPTITNADYAFSPNASGAIFDWMAAFGDATPAELAILLFGNYDTTKGDLSLWLNVVYAGRQSAVQPLLNSLLAEVTPYRQNISEVPWNKMLYTNFFGVVPNAEAGCAGKGTNRSVYGGALKSYEKAAWNGFVANFSDFLRANEDARGSIFFIEQFSKVKVLQIPDDETAYPWRDVTAHLLWNYGWHKDETLATIERYGKHWRDKLQAFSGFSPQEIYVNYGHGDESSEVLYGAKKLPKLRRLKQIWDPKNVFGFYDSFVKRG